MADTKDGFIVTRAGLNVLAKAIAGKQLKFVRVALGDSETDGEIVPVTDEEAFEQTGLINWKKDLPMVGQPTVNGGVANIKFLIQNADVTEGFFMRETGIFVKDPDTNQDVLYAYENIGLRGNWLPPLGGSHIYQQQIIAAIAVAQAANITAVIDDSLIYVTQSEFQAHIDDTNPHPNIPNLAQSVSETNYIWASGTDNNLHPMSISDLTRQALGGNASDIPQMNSRISQAEVNIANIYTQLKIEEDLGLKPNLLIFDDFVNPDKTDYYRQNVITSVAGISNVRVASNDGLHSGSWYTLSDGVHNEPVQVTAVAKNGDAHVAIFDEPVINTYDLTCTQLYRSTTLIENGVGVGAGDIRTDVFNFSASWQGTGSNTSTNIMLNTTFENQAAFELSGEWAFSADGEFTLA